MRIYSFDLNICARPLGDDRVIVRHHDAGLWKSQCDVLEESSHDPTTTPRSLLERILFAQNVEDGRKAQIVDAAVDQDEIDRLCAAGHRPIFACSLLHLRFNRWSANIHFPVGLRARLLG